MSLDFDTIQRTLAPMSTSQGREHMARVAQLPCVICHEWNMQQLSPTQVHHCIHGRGGNRRAPDNMTIPLCEGCHQGLLDTSKIALHREPRLWVQKYGQDIHWISWAEKRLGMDL